MRISLILGGLLIAAASAHADQQTADSIRLKALHDIIAQTPPTERNPNNPHFKAILEEYKTVQSHVAVHNPPKVVGPDGTTKSVRIIPQEQIPATVSERVAKARAAMGKD